MNKVTSFEEACQILGRDPKKAPDFSLLITVTKEEDAELFEEQQSEVNYLDACFKLPIVVQAVNGKDFKADFANWNQLKYFPWLKAVKDAAAPGGVRFAYDDFGYVRSTTCVGSRLCSKDRETARYIVETFPDLYNALFR